MDLPRCSEIPDRCTAFERVGSRLGEALNRDGVGTRRIAALWLLSLITVAAVSSALTIAVMRPATPPVSRAGIADLGSSEIGYSLLIRGVLGAGSRSALPLRFSVVFEYGGLIP